jgi:Transposase DDE domain group 1
VMHDGRPVTADVSADGEGLVSHAGSALLARMADKIGLTRALSLRLASAKERCAAHHGGAVVRDLAVMIADRGDCLADLWGLRDQRPLFGEVASDSTAYRVIERIAADPALLSGLRAARAMVRSRAWELGVRPELVTIDQDATFVTAHSLKEGAAGHYKGGFGFAPLMIYLDESGEALASLLRPGNRGATTPPTRLRRQK